MITHARPEVFLVAALVHYEHREIHQEREAEFSKENEGRGEAPDLEVVGDFFPDEDE